MKNQFLPFQIGEQYEKWEFDLELLDEERIKGCDSYAYLGNALLLNEKAQKAELIFSLDILVGVIMDFEFENKAKLEKFVEIFNSVFSIHSINHFNYDLGNIKINIQQTKTNYLIIIYSNYLYPNLLSL